VFDSHKLFTFQPSPQNPISDLSKDNLLEKKKSTDEKRKKKNVITNIKTQ
jgi:hypothetical protein